jgi:hypothetical protein
MLDVAATIDPDAHVSSEADADEAQASAIRRAEERLRILDELTDIGMNIARSVERRAMAEAATAETMDPKTRGAPSVAAHRDPADAFARVSRAIRLTLTLATRAEDELRALRAGVPLEREKRRAESVKRADAAKADRRRKVDGIVTDLLVREHGDDADGYEAADEALQERLSDDEAYQDLVDRPLREIVERLCKDLCLTPDWSLWTGDGWARDENGRLAWSIFGQPSRTPLIRTWPPPDHPEWE